MLNTYDRYHRNTIVAAIVLAPFVAVVLTASVVTDAAADFASQAKQAIAGGSLIAEWADGMLIEAYSDESIIPDVSMEEVISAVAGGFEAGTLHENAVVVQTVPSVHGTSEATGAQNGVSESAASERIYSVTVAAGVLMAAQEELVPDRIAVYAVVRSSMGEDETESSEIVKLDSSAALSEQTDSGGVGAGLVRLALSVTEAEDVQAEDWLVTIRIPAEVCVLVVDMLDEADLSSEATSGSTSDKSEATSGSSASARSEAASGSCESGETKSGGAIPMSETERETEPTIRHEAETEQETAAEQETAVRQETEHETEITEYEHAPITGESAFRLVTGEQTF